MGNGTGAADHGHGESDRPPEPDPRARQRDRRHPPALDERLAARRCGVRPPARLRRRLGSLATGADTLISRSNPLPWSSRLRPWSCDSTFDCESRLRDRDQRTTGSVLRELSPSISAPRLLAARPRRCACGCRLAHLRWDGCCPATSSVDVAFGVLARDRRVRLQPRRTFRVPDSRSAPGGDAYRDGMRRSPDRAATARIRSSCCDPFVARAAILDCAHRTVALRRREQRIASRAAAPAPSPRCSAQAALIALRRAARAALRPDVRRQRRRCEPRGASRERLPRRVGPLALRSLRLVDVASTPARSTRRGPSTAFP